MPTSTSKSKPKSHPVLVVFLLILGLGMTIVIIKLLRFTKSTGSITIAVDSTDPTQLVLTNNSTVNLYYSLTDSIAPGTIYTFKPTNTTIASSSIGLDFWTISLTFTNTVNISYVILNNNPITVALPATIKTYF